MPRHYLRFFLPAVCCFALTSGLHAQELPASEDDEPVVRDSGVGYIDSAYPLSQFRLRFDAAYRSNRPTRGEFFYPRGGAAGPGLPRPDPLVDYQDLSAYVEYAPAPRLSVFLDTPYRFINPTVNDNASGFSDLIAGFKWSFWQTPDAIATFQFKTYIPTGVSERGLGTHHVSLEPGVLFSQQLAPKVLLSGEAGYWIPIDGTDFAGGAFRYGLGLTFGQRDPCRFWATPVAEFVGWTFVAGKEAAVYGPGAVVVQDAAGDSILNAKVGLRFGVGDRFDVYTGYGRALTGDVLYKDIMRVEFRLLF